MIYFPTKKMSAKEAFEEFWDLCDRIGIDASNIPYPTELFLRNNKFEDIDHVSL